MTAYRTAGVTKRLPVFKSIAQCYGSVCSRPWRLMIVAALPLCGCLTLSAGFLASSLIDHPAAPLYFLMFLIPMSYLGLNWTRCRLREQPPRFLPDHPWAAAYGKIVAWYFVWSFCVWGLPGFLVVAAMIPLYGVLEHGEVTTIMSFIPLAWLLLSLLGTAIFARLFLALPLIATGQPAVLAELCGLEPMRGSRFGVAMFLLTTVHVILSAACAYALAVIAELTIGRSFMDLAMHDTYYVRAQIHYIIVFGIVLPLSAVLGTALFAELTVIGFRHFTDRNGSRTDILERFD